MNPTLQRIQICAFKLLLLALLLLLGPLGARADLPVQPPGCSEEALRELYEDIPYPERFPADERPGAVAWPTLDDPAVLEHVAGRSLAPWRVLVAGGGTGDATVQLAVLLERRGQPAHIVQVDLSAASLRVAHERLQRHEPLRHVRVALHQRSLRALEDPAAVRELGGPFSYINCVGVVHHTPDPARALRGLAGALAPGGLMQLGVYGALGRRGIYDVRRMLKLAGVPATDPATAQALWRGLPATNWMRRNEMAELSEDLQGRGWGVADMLLNPCDVAYDVEQLLELVGQAGLAVRAAVVPEEYEPLPTGVPAVDARVAALPWEARARFAELQRGTESMHGVYVGRAADDEPAARGPKPLSPASVLCTPATLQGLTFPGGDDAREFPDVTHRWDFELQSFGRLTVKGLPALAPLLMEFAGGCRLSLAEQHARLPAVGVQYAVSLEEYVAQAELLLERQAGAAWLVVPLVAPVPPGVPRGVDDDGPRT